jgi:hypothetical protein
MDAGGKDYIARLTAMDAAAEQAALNSILTTGFDQGCFLRPDEGDLLPNLPAATSAILEALEARDVKAKPSVDDPFQNRRPPSTSIPGEETGYVILTQGCDLIRAFEDEPFIELAHVSLCQDSSVVEAARSNSPRFLLLADGPDGQGWVVDLRHQARLAKDRLATYPLVQPVADDNAFKRFKMRVGNRYSRDALPTDLVEAIQWPLRKCIQKNATLNKAAAVFSDLLVFREDDGLAFIRAVYGPNGDQEQAEEAWDTIESALPQEVADLLTDDSGAIRVEDVGWWDYTAGWKMELDEVSYGRKGAIHAKPAQTEPSSRRISARPDS